MMITLWRRAVSACVLAGVAMMASAEAATAAQPTAECGGAGLAQIFVSGSTYEFTVFQPADDSWRLVVTRNGRPVHRDTVEAQDVSGDSYVQSITDYTWLADFGDIYLRPKPKAGKLVFTATNTQTKEVCTAVLKRG